ncbi:hypothetical protein DNHGIG_09310 [Collibacillus ludicampi]|uniref:DUF3055 domain-containing protein n=1 Tax=Collibacillus ludicampi TaxID=2771369 RepID=A0AAV4LC06_9BACL|nr:DUF3055 domain-containing protein [Collibacillus ludicampi]GIM45382.1 hypothetical protein DNHGIG_09310 [Collibacillus ludicampi]
MEQILFDHEETTRTRHVGFIKGGRRFDFTLTYSQHFLGKTIVTCLQTGRSALLDIHDIHIPDILSSKFGLNDEEARHLAGFLETPLSDRMIHTQY